MLISSNPNINKNKKIQIQVNLYAVKPCKSLNILMTLSGLGLWKMHI